MVIFLRKEERLISTLLTNAEYSEDIVVISRTDATILLVFAVVAVIVLLIISFYFKVLKPFSRERDYIKMELYRSSSNHEYNYWKRELRYLYLKHIPLVRLFKRKIPK